MDLFSTLATNPNPTIALLATLVVILSGVVVYQWHYTMKNTVPKWIWDEFVAKVDKLIETSTVIKERIGKK
jgi:cell shape-determining protein MreD